MNKFTKILLSLILAVLFALSLAACDKTGGSEDAVTRFTLELVDADGDEALADEALLDEGEAEYYAVSGYSFSTEDSEILSRAKDNPYYYTDKYDGPRKDSEDYKKELERYEALKTLVLPVAVKVSVAESRINLDEKQLASAKDGVIDLTEEGATETRTVKIRAIKDSALVNHTEIIDLVVPDSYLYIGAGAFAGCASLESITLPFVGREPSGNVNDKKVFGYVFGSSEFDGGVSVTQSYNLSGTASAKYIPGGLKKVTVSASVPEYAFHGMSMIEEIVCPEFTAGSGIEEIPAYAFYGCSALKEVKLAATVKTIGSGAFDACTGLRSVNFAELTALEKVGSDAFNGCTRLCYADKKLVIPASVTYIGENAFASLPNVKEIEVKAAAKVTVKQGAFSGLSSLETVTLENVDLTAGVFATWPDVLTVNYKNCTFLGEELSEKVSIEPAFPGCFTEDKGLQKKNIEFVAN